MADLNIDSFSLDDLILELEKDNEDINTVIKNINNAIRTLDKNKWNSKEKEKYDEQFIPYMEKLDNQILSYLNNCTDLLKNANKEYKELDLKNKKNIENTNNSITVDII